MTKEDLKTAVSGLRAELKADNAVLQEQIKSTRSNLQEQIKSTRSEIRFVLAFMVAMLVPLFLRSFGLV